MRDAKNSLFLQLCAVAVALALPAMASATEYTVNISGLSFVLAEMTIEVGDTVTWTNDGGNHNVLADDGSFGSGPPSTDLWVYSYTFHKGGVYPYACEIHGGSGMTGTITVVGVFGDTFASGDTAAWDETEPLRDGCTCYFSSDCAGGSFCDYGPGGFSTEDLCTWMDVKPEGVPGAGCNIPHIGAWGGDICDGLCSGSRTGSNLGYEDRKLLSEGVRMWSEAMLRPAELGGGPPDGELVNGVLELGFDLSYSAYSLGRQVADLLVLSGSPGFYGYFCHYEQHPDEPAPERHVDLSGDSCRVATARLLIEAVVAEIGSAGAGSEVLAELDTACVDWRQLVSSRCPAGNRSLACVQKRIADTAVFLTTPRNSPGFDLLTNSSGE